MASLIKRRLQELWSQLQGKKPHLPHFLTEIRLQGIRGISNLKAAFDYPVTVIAGGNASGKSTVLFAAACAYRVPGAGVKDFVPSTLFPDYRPRSGGREDHRNEVVLNFEYATPEGHYSMQWRRRAKGWNRSFGGRKNASQPKRLVYLRTLSNLSNPSEVRGVLSMSRSAQAPQEMALTASQVELAHQMLPFRYSEVVKLSNGSKALLFAAQKGGSAYSELHMSAGERAILRLSQDIAQRKGALILIDELEAGLHPWVQQLLMMQLQQLALRNDLQVIVTTHSPVVLDAVPRNGRIFLERDETGEVTVRPAYRDIIQNALYGRSPDALNLLCEDKAAEGILQGVLDVLLPELEIRTESVRIGRDTGADEFPSHASAFRKFGQIKSFVFVLDGDKRDKPAEKKLSEQMGSDSIFFLPGDVPEAWVWKALKQFSAADARALGLGEEELTTKLNQLDALYDSASDSLSRIAKTKLRQFAEDLGRTEPELARAVGRLEAENRQSDIQPLVENLKGALLRWRDGDVAPS
ncbi:MAG: AAA family ATPase [Cyanobacteria bacterium MAG IRC1_bin_28]|nr:AAA family ATPase [Cyanobacteria bacterium MAG IRC1_bin_28]